MDKITEKIIERRAAITTAHQEFEVAKSVYELAEADLYIRCDYKTLGSNEAERKARFTLLVQEKLSGQLAQLRYAEARKSETYTALEAAQDARRAYENELRRCFLQEKYNVNVSLADFEALLAEF